MMQRSILTLMLVGIALMGITGCYGPSPGMDPIIDLTIVDEETYGGGIIPAGTTITLNADATTADEGANPVVSLAWSQSAAIAGSRYILGADYSAVNVWVAPLRVDAPTPMTLSVIAETLQGGKAEKSITLTVIPRNELPQYDFDEMAILAQVPSWPYVPRGEQFRVEGEVRGEDLSPLDGVSFTWWQEPKIEPTDEYGFFESTTVKNPLWRAPYLDDPVTYRLLVRTRTVDGAENVNALVIIASP